MESAIKIREHQLTLCVLKKNKIGGKSFIRFICQHKLPMPTTKTHDLEDYISWLSEDENLGALISDVHMQLQIDH